MRTSGKLPNLGRPAPPPINQNAVMDEINDLRMQKSKLEVEARQIRSKTARMKQILHDRNSQIKKALTVTDEKTTSIKTASDSTLSQLRANIASLSNTLESREAELESLRQNDKLAISDELQVEVCEYFLEYERLQKQLEIVREGETILDGEVENLKQQIISAQSYDRHITEIQGKINELADKMLAYRQGDQRMDINMILERVAAKPKSLSSEREALQKEIESMTEQKEQIEEEVKVILENDKKNQEFLLQILTDQAEKIERAIQEQQSQKK